MTRLKHNDSEGIAEDCCSRPGCGHRRRFHSPGPQRTFETSCRAIHHNPFGGLGKPCACPEFLEPRKTARRTGKDTRVSMRARWQGEVPKVGEFLMSQGPGTKFAYQIATITPTRTADLYEVEADKVLCTKLPTGAVVHAWKWDSRHRKMEEGTSW